MPLEILADGWRKAGVQDGDLLLVHSNIIRTVMQFREQRMAVTPADILESFLMAVGPSGTLLLPAFNFDFTKGVPFDIRNTPSKMGVLTEVGRLHPRAVRTGHPIYSFIAIGKQAERFRGVDNFSGYGPDSPFAMLREMDGRIAALDLSDQNCMTFYHHVEEMNNAPYRYHKTFTGPYTDAAGTTGIRTYGLFVRDLERRVLTHVDPAGELLWRAGLYAGFRENEGCGLRTISARKMYEFVSGILASGNAKNVLYRIEGETP